MQPPVAFSARTLLAGRHEEHPACKNWVMGCWCGYLSGSRFRLFAYGPADATVIPNPIISALPLAKPMCLLFWEHPWAVQKLFYWSCVPNKARVRWGSRSSFAHTKGHFGWGTVVWGLCIQSWVCGGDAACCRITRTLIAYISLFSRGLMTTWLFAVN